MLDKDLAELYDVPTKVLKQAVRRNIARFPDDFMFQLSIEEIESSRSQIVTLKQGHNIKYPPFAFTEQGIAMLSSVLRSEKAIQTNIFIMRAFTRMTEMSMTHQEVLSKLATLEKEIVKTKVDVSAVVRLVRELIKEKEKRGKIGYRK